MSKNQQPSTRGLCIVYIDNMDVIGPQLYDKSHGIVHHEDAFNPLLPEQDPVCHALTKRGFMYRRDALYQKRYHRYFGSIKIHFV